MLIVLKGRKVMACRGFDWFEI